MQIHVVHPGETLWLISQRYGITVTQIVTANELENPNKLVRWVGPCHSNNN